MDKLVAAASRDDSGLGDSLRETPRHPSTPSRPLSLHQTRSSPSRPTPPTDTVTPTRKNQKRKKHLWSPAGKTHKAAAGDRCRDENDIQQLLPLCHQLRHQSAAPAHLSPVKSGVSTPQKRPLSTSVLHEICGNSPGRQKIKVSSPPRRPSLPPSPRPQPPRIHPFSIDALLKKSPSGKDDKRARVKVYEDRQTPRVPVYHGEPSGNRTHTASYNPPGPVEWSPAVTSGPTVSPSPLADRRPLHTVNHSTPSSSYRDSPVPFLPPGYHSLGGRLPGSFLPPTSLADGSLQYPSPVDSSLYPYGTSPYPWFLPVALTVPPGSQQDSRQSPSTEVQQAQVRPCHPDTPVPSTSQQSAKQPRQRSRQPRSTSRGGRKSKPSATVTRASHQAKAEVMPANQPTAGPSSCLENDVDQDDQTEAGAAPDSQQRMTVEDAVARMQWLCNYVGEQKQVKLEISPSFHDLLQKWKREIPGFHIHIVNEGFAVKDAQWEDPAKRVRTEEEVLPDGETVQVYVFRKKRHKSRRAANREARRSHGPYLCIYCLAREPDATDMKRHTRTHTKVHPFKCNRCTADFTQYVSLEVHMKAQHGVPMADKNSRRPKFYICELTGSLFHNSEVYVQHLRENFSWHSHLRKTNDRRIYKQPEPTTSL